MFFFESPNVSLIIAVKVNLDFSGRITEFISKSSRRMTLMIPFFSEKKIIISQSENRILLAKSPFFLSKAKM